MKKDTQYNELKDLLLKEIMYDTDELSELKENQILLVDRGYKYVEHGEYHKAFKLFSYGTTFNNTDPEILTGLGITLSELGMLQESKLVLERAVRLNPDDAITFANLASVCWEMEHYDQAIFNYKKSINYDPEIEDTYLNLINLYMEIGYLYMAFLTCNHLLTIFPDNIEARELINEIILNLGISIY